MESNAVRLPWECELTYGGGARQNVRGYEPFPQWPIKLLRISSTAPFFHHANLLFAADCSAFEYGNFHTRMTKNRVPVICCPADDLGNKIEQKLCEIIKLNDIESITLLRMDAPCCSNMSQILFRAVKSSGKSIPLRITTVFVEGDVEN